MRFAELIDNDSSGDTDSGRRELAGRLRPAAERAVDAEPLRPATQASLDGLLTDTVHSLLDGDLVSAFAAGWRASDELRTAAKQSLAQPGVPILVELRHQRIEHEMRPEIALYVDQRRVGTLALTIAVAAMIEAATVGVESGAIVSVHFGSCRVEMAVTDDQGHSLIKGSRTLTRSAQLNLPARIPLLFEPGTAAADAPAAAPNESTGSRPEALRMPAARFR